MNPKRILAIAGLAIIVLLYAVSLVCAFIGSPLARSVLMAAMFCTVVVPCIIYAFQLVFHKKDSTEEE